MAIEHVQVSTVSTQITGGTINLTSPIPDGPLAELCSKR
jgi:hypothetical protein